MNPLRMVCWIICVAVTVDSTAQEVTLSVDRVSLTTVFKRIEQQTGYTSWITKEQLRRSRPVTIHVTDRPLREVLETIFANQPLGYTLIERNIVVTDASSPKKKPATLANTERHLRGRVTDTLKQALSDVSVLNMVTGKFVLSDQQGYFRIPADSGHVLQLSYVGMQSVTFPVHSRTPVNVILKVDSAEATPVVFYSGYEGLRPDRAIGAYYQVGKNLLSRSAAISIDERLMGLPGGLLFTRVYRDEGGFTLRSRNTIFADERPLIVLDNFPFEEGLQLINPADIENITILKDAAASSIWGARAANGVLVVTTHRGNYRQPGRVSFTSNHTFCFRPNLYREPGMSSADVIAIETFIFNAGAYEQTISKPYEMISPVVLLLQQHRQGMLSASELQQKLSVMSAVDQRAALMRYYYRPSINRQYALSYSGGNDNNRYYLSLGADRNLPDKVNSQFERTTATASYDYTSKDKKFKLSASGLLTHINERSGGDPMTLWSYQPWTDASGKAAVSYLYRRGWLDTVAGGKLMDWGLSPLRELALRSGRTQEIYTQMTLQGVCEISKGLQFSLMGRVGLHDKDVRFLDAATSFRARDMVNRFTQVNDQGQLTSPVPQGAILEHSVARSATFNGRAQLSYTSRWEGNHSLIALAGGELQGRHYRFRASQTLGYGTIAATDSLDHSTEYPLIFYPGSSEYLPGPFLPEQYHDRYLSAFATASYSFKGRYIISGSLRKDASNLFGAETNRKGVPLWSAGGSWHISRESFMVHKAITSLRVRATFGTNGNIDKRVFAMTTVGSGYTNVFSNPYAPLVNPPNARLKWEQVFTANYGMDIRLWEDRITVNFDLYFKRGRDLTADGPMPPSSGIGLLRGNFATIRGSGWELLLHSVNTRKPLRWESTFSLNYNKDEITSYPVLTSPLGIHTGYPYSALFAYRWAGLDGSGEPQGYLNGQTSTDWTMLVNTDSLAINTAYIGPAYPRYFGAWLHTLSWRRLSVSMNVVFKFGHYRRLPSVNYTQLFQELNGTADFSRRWQQPGDELKTSVPAMTYPANAARDQFYAGAAPLVQPSGHIRLLDVRASYALVRNETRKKISSCDVYVYIRNLGIIWSAAGKRVDPEPSPVAPAPLSFTLGFQLSF